MCRFNCKEYKNITSNLNYTLNGMMHKKLGMTKKNNHIKCNGRIGGLDVACAALFSTPDKFSGTLKFSGKDKY